MNLLTIESIVYLSYILVLTILALKKANNYLWFGWIGFGVVLMVLMEIFGPWVNLDNVFGEGI